MNCVSKLSLNARVSCWLTFLFLIELDPDE